MAKPPMGKWHNGKPSYSPLGKKSNFPAMSNPPFMAQDQSQTTTLKSTGQRARAGGTSRAGKKGKGKSGRVSGAVRGGYGKNSREGRT